MLIPYLVLGLDIGAKAIKAGFETAREQYYSSNSKLIEKNSIFEVVTVNVKGRIISREQHIATQVIENINDVFLEMVYIPSGKLIMGSNEKSNEKPIHTVCTVTFGNGVQIIIKVTIIMLQLMVVFGKNIANTEYCVEGLGTVILIMFGLLTVIGTFQLNVTATSVCSLVEWT